MKYLAIKVKTLNYYIWFEKEQVTIENGRFIGKNGWGKGGALTNIEVPEREISSKIESDSLQYR